MADEAAVGDRFRLLAGELDERALRLGADSWASDDAQVVAAAGRLLTAIAA